jgi:hypothetical protein
MCRALRQTAFFNGKLIAPRRLNEMGQAETAACLDFLETADEAVARERGCQLALQGLGHRSILMMTEALRRACRERVDLDEEATGRYIIALLEGYMAGREQDLLQVQERTRDAFLRARERQAGGR